MIRFPARIGLCLFTAALCFSAFDPAAADLAQVLPDMGSLENWTIFTLGQGNGGNHFSRNINVQGDIGVAGNGDLAVMGNSLIDGNIYCDSEGTLRIGPNVTLTGSTFHNQDSEHDDGILAAMANAQVAPSLQPTPFFTQTVALSRNTK